MTHLIQVGFAWTDSRAQSIDEARRLARKSLELDERETLAHVVLAHAFGLAGQQQQMIASLERVIESDPNNAAPYGHLGYALSYTGRPEEAIAYLEKAMRLSPKDYFMFQWLTCMGWAHISAGRYEEAVSWLERSRQSRPDYQLTHRALAAAYAQVGRAEEAQAALREDLRLAPDDSISRIKAQIPEADPTLLERYLDGLRKAGLKE